MATITTRAGKGAPLTNAEVDANFTGLNNELATKTTTAQAAAAAPVQSVAGKTGAVTLGPADVGAAAASHTHTKAQITDLSLGWTDITGKPSTFTPSAHSHAIADVSGLQAAINNSVTLDGAQTVSGTKVFAMVQQGRYVRQSISIPNPGPNVGAGRWFVRLCPTTSAVFISARIRLCGIWSYAPIMGALELECGAYIEQGGTGISAGSSRLCAATGPAHDNLRVSDLMVVGGWVGVYVWSSNSNSVDVLFDGTVLGEFDLSYSAWEASALPPQRAVQFTGGIELLSGQLSGNAATATKLATARSISLAGDVTGSATFDGSANISITATVADDSHNHTIANVDGLQGALDGKAAASHTHSFSNITGGTTFAGLVVGGTASNWSWPGGLEIRERSGLGAGVSAWEDAPRIGFHWGARHVKNIGLRSDGLMAIENDPIALYSNLAGKAEANHTHAPPDQAAIGAIHNLTINSGNGASYTLGASMPASVLTYATSRGGGTISRGSAVGAGTWRLLSSHADQHHTFIAVRIA